MFWFWFFVGPALTLAFRSLTGESERADYIHRRLAETSEYSPPASVIVPVKGHDDGLRENLAALAALDYPDYELIVVARSAADIPPGVLPARSRVVLANREEPGTSEKVLNLAAAVQATRKRSQIFAFADSDGRVTPRWLRALAAPLADDGVGASTGYRWFTPQPAAFWALLRGVWDAVPAGMLGPGRNRFAWGGAMAIRKETFLEALVFSYWKDTISDDYALSAAVRAAGLTIAYAPGALVPCLERITAPRFFAWIRRQMMITRVYNPKQWGPGLIAHVFYCGGMAASAAAIARGHGLAWWALAAQLAPGMVKGWRRARLARRALPEQERWFRRWEWVHTAAVPVATWIWLVALVSSAFGRTIEWRGYRYRLKTPGGV
ncbi:MAG: glycosyltransferase [Acidobacteriia bacterium]|nr:glycosyltransferase [Terriglobia bacterium]